jgi:AmmeMemoRadiSam system protein A
MSSEETKQAPVEAFEITVAQKRDLLQLARNAMAAYTAGLPLPLAELPEMSSVHAGVFVSLHVGEELRGCIGCVDSVRALPEALSETAIAAASRDPRFEPLTADELAQVEVEISVLSPLRRVASPAEITLGKHGVMVKLGHHQGLLLPQVALHHDWDMETFLTHVCQKAGLPAQAWKEPNTDIFVFEAEVFSESQLRQDN